MKRIFVIADDLTGAAEIGGIAIRHGLTATIHHTVGGNHVQLHDDRTQAVIVDAHTRHLPPAEAAFKVSAILQQFHPKDFDFIYKKTDSMLRGPVAAELVASMSALHLDRTLFVPQNPSRKRIIENGRYFIDGIPLDQSPVAIDPEYPSATADVRLLLDPEQKLEIHCASPTQGDLKKGITIGQAANAAHIQEWTVQKDANTLLAGGADFITALLESIGLSTVTLEKFTQNPRGSITIFGSASTPSREFVAKLCAAGVAVCDIPLDITALKPHNHQLLEELKSPGRGFVAARRPVSSEFAERIRQNKAELIAQVSSKTSIKTLIIEGGATASAIMQRLHWNIFDVQSELAPGIVALRPAAQAHPILILKPGTYPWPQGLMPELAR